MRNGAKILRMLTLIGQLGLSVAAPPLLLIWLAHLAETRWGVGPWATVAAIVVGLISAGCGAYNFAKRIMAKQQKDDAPPGFNDHT
ncbi:MAG: AtpZ/AtpI family protein [Oscillospiraceae bacterium]|nr:AtpZ/AtpI family protein [Oscillospiraceae bacterium]